MIRVFWKGNQITGYIGSCTWSGTDTQVSRILEFTVAYSPYDKDFKKPDIQLGDILTLYEDKELLFYGEVSARESKSEGGFLSYTARDYMTHILKSHGTYQFENRKAEQIAKLICADAHVDVDRLASTKINIDTLFFRDRSFYEIIMAAYTKAAKKDGKKYMPTMVGRKFAVIEKGKVIPNFWLNQGETIQESSYAENLESMVNRVAIYDSEHKKIGEVSNGEWVKKYGLYQNSIHVESGNGKTEAENELFGIEKTASITCLGDTRCTAGKGIVIRDTLSGIKGKFWIQSDAHTWAEDGTYTMNLELAFENIMETFEPDEKEETQEYGSNSVAGNKILNGQKVRAKFTAYYPANNAMEGGFLDALGNKLNPSHNTMAAPPSISFHTMIQILETGTARDGQEYEVLDRGGAIQIEAGNVYHFDILMSSAAECNAWGVRMGYAVIGNGTGYTTTGVAAAGNSVIERATAQMEAWANDNTHGYSQANRWGPDYDCSSSVIQAWQNAGVLVKSRGATYTGNMYSVFLSCGFKDVTSSCNLSTGAGMQRGDVLLNHVHHTAMYCGNGKEVEARGASFGSAAPGDLTGDEFAIISYRNYPWNCVLRYAG